MASERELSERLEELADRLEYAAGDWDKTMDIAEEIRKLSTEKYAPGNSMSWKDVKPKKTVKKDKFGRELPF